MPQLPQTEESRIAATITAQIELQWNRRQRKQPLNHNSFCSLKRVHQLGSQQRKKEQLREATERGRSLPFTPTQHLPKQSAHQMHATVCRYSIVFRKRTLCTSQPFTQNRSNQVFPQKLLYYSPLPNTHEVGKLRYCEEIDKS